MSLSVALNRFGLGARPDELVHSDSQAWLVTQLLSYDPLPAAWKQQPRTATLVGTWNDMQRSVRMAPEGQRSGIREQYLRDGSLVYQAAVGARTASALESSTPFVERLVHFWSNHFAVSVDKLLTRSPSQIFFVSLSPKDVTILSIYITYAKDKYCQIKNQIRR